ncbi:hypothetical protein VB773_07170 [Haloarculaceae archaeon H-GB2-1]|nr:hypothetical protein [Haloarculaceae archaeon H-GB1-1]MEA5385864.1 hypothetical protein [Haloarculaceae archaeon H-GB11]MEA5407368.1 hypothetical protein [Haloarculaceae archaeon H-GB2-1]
MVGPITDAERADSRLKLKLAFILLVAASGGLITLLGDGGVPAFVLATVIGGVVGAALVWFVFPTGLSEFR